MSNTQKPLKEIFLAFQVIPRVKEGNNFEVVDKAIEVVKNANVPYQVGAMETTMKGELDHLLEVVKRAQQACYDAGALEVITNIKIHSKTPEATDTFCTYDRGVTKANHMFIDEK
ncbi:MAG: thiamine-binding protein [Sulfurovum sp.]|uniref:thiamine-binding protein n=1 Tax=Sulfurovum sp. TaxID=1969726 RepID=UPI00286832BA|nr:thiamine-binding protein [Sulfurovum sp.]MCO4846015.1 thiamine-binding protein [Sulfurovum sp.]